MPGLKMSKARTLTGGIIVHSRTTLYEFAQGADQAVYLFADATYTGDLDGPAAETFVAVTHPDGSQTHYGFGQFTGRALGRSGTLYWKFKGKPGSGVMEIFGGTGDIAGLRGEVTYEITPGSTSQFTYQGQLE